MANAICRSCGNDDVDPNTGSYELCEACWDGFEQDMYEQLETDEAIDEYEDLNGVDSWDYYGLNE